VITRNLNLIINIGVTVSKCIKGIIFDMDGTLTIPSIDFIELRRILDMKPDQDLLKVLETYGEEKKKYTIQIIEKFEKEASDNIELQPNVNSVLCTFNKLDIKMGIVTRNSKTNAAKVLSLIDIDFDPVLSREFIPYKPDPAPVNFILDNWNIKPENVMIVGDYRDDIQCGINAGISTCFFMNSDKTSYAELSDYSVSSFEELKNIIITVNE